MLISSEKDEPQFAGYSSGVFFIVPVSSYQIKKSPLIQRWDLSRYSRRKDIFCFLIMKFLSDLFFSDR